MAVSTDKIAFSYLIGLSDVYTLKDSAIIAFNDRKKTTWVDVKAVLKRAKAIVKAAPVK